MSWGGSNVSLTLFSFALSFFTDRPNRTSIRIYVLCLVEFTRTWISVFLFNRTKKRLKTLKMHFTTFRFLLATRSALQHSIFSGWMDTSWFLCFRSMYVFFLAKHLHFSHLLWFHDFFFFIFLLLSQSLFSCLNSLSFFIWISLCFLFILNFFFLIFFSHHRQICLR